MTSVHGFLPIGASRSTRLKEPSDHHRWGPILLPRWLSGCKCDCWARDFGVSSRVRLSITGLYSDVRKFLSSSTDSGNVPVRLPEAQLAPFPILASPTTLKFLTPKRQCTCNASDISGVHERRRLFTIRLPEAQLPPPPFPIFLIPDFPNNSLIPNPQKVDNPLVMLLVFQVFMIDTDCLPSASKGADGSRDGKQSPPPMDTRNTRSVKELKSCWGIGAWEDWENWDSGNPTHTTQAGNLTYITKHNASVISRRFSNLKHIDWTYTNELLFTCEH
uniref:SFRICE_014222 n=1 Tax=Spodoptera frugiperda TaxID=7108 RepID=A0A2H1VMG2_SPOFR